MPNADRKCGPHRRITGYLHGERMEQRKRQISRQEEINELA